MEADLARSAAKKERKRKIRIEGNFHSWQTVILPSIARVREQTVSNLRDIWWEGVPDQLKSKVWTTAMSTFTKETLTKELYDSVLAQVNELKDRSQTTDQLDTKAHSQPRVSPPPSPTGQDWKSQSAPDISREKSTSTPTSPRPRRVRNNQQPDTIEWSDGRAITLVLNQIFINTPAPFSLERAKNLLDNYLYHTKIE